MKRCLCQSKRTSSSTISLVERGIHRTRPRHHSTIPIALRHTTTSTIARHLDPSLQFGQPLPLTHPHLLKPNELTIGIQASEYELRRKTLMKELEIGSVVVVAGGRIKWMAHHVFYKFRQTSDFWYLTGWQEPDSVLILERDESERGYRMTMIIPPKDIDAELWNGARTGLAGAVNLFGADEAIEISRLASFLRPILTKSSKSPVYIDLPDDVSLAQPSKRSLTSTGKSNHLLDFLSPTLSQFGDLANLTTSLSKSNKSDIDACLSIFSPSSKSKLNRPLTSLKPKLDTLRSLKSEGEIVLMKRAAEISSLGHQKAMKLACRSSELSEHDIVTEFESYCSRQGSIRPAYVPVCASGSSSLTIHYTSNNSMLRQHDMVLLDAGCEFAGYCSDITRTFPISVGEADSKQRGKFTSPQRDLYQAVLNVEKELIKKCRECDDESLATLHKLSCEWLRKEVQQLGFNLRSGDLERLYPHYLGHHLGVDLHDVSSVDRTTKLRRGMVVTIEPGIYVPDSTTFPKHFRGLGVRIEDEVLIQANDEDPIILSVSAPKEIVDVETCCSGLLDDIS